MKKLLLHLLEMTSETYENWILDNYFLWCNLNSFDDQDCQKLLANAALFQWWNREYSILEAKFIKRSLDYSGKVDKRTMREYYTNTVINIQHYYSKPLIQQARKHQPITPQLN